MKKLMLTAGAAAIAAGAFATAPTVYDYKASVKHMYLKEVVVHDTSLANPQKVHVYQKIQKTSSLKGYLVQDTQACLGGKIAVQANTDTRAWDQRRNRAFLVVLNSSAMPAEIRQPKILPAVLEAKFLDKALNNKSYLTEGMLFVGGDLVVAGQNAAQAGVLYNNLRPYLMPGKLTKGVYGATVPAQDQNQSIEYVAASGGRLRQTAKAYYGDYLWTSAYLFGQYNGPQWSTDNWSISEKKVIDAMPVFMRPRKSAIGAAETYINPTGAGTGNGYYHDTWMNHAGFGTGSAGVTAASVCCGISTPASVAVKLDSLSGNMKGGLFICSENGFYTGLEAAAPYGVYRKGALWDDQFWTASINTVVGDVFGFAAPAYFGATALTTHDKYQMDVWTDGDIETFTTDVMSGTWSIKLNTKLAGVKLTDKEVKNTFLIGAVAGSDPAINTTAPSVAGFIDDNRQDVWDFNEMLKGAALALSKTVIFANSHEISEKLGNADRFKDLPMITPKFAAAYGLDGQQLWAATPDIKGAAAGKGIYK